MPNWENYYEILGVDPAASSEEIRAAWRRRAMDLHPDLLRQASEAERHSAEESLKRANRAYEVLRDVEKRRGYHADWLRSTRPPKPVVEPSVIVFHDAAPGKGKTGSFVIRNDGGPYSSIWFSDPKSWVTVTGYASLEPGDELPLQVEVSASGYEWGQHYTESIAVRLDGVEAAVGVELHTKPAPASYRTGAVAASPRSAGFPIWGKLLGFAAAVATVVMVIVTSIPEQTGAPANSGRSPAIQSWSTGSNYLGTQPNSSRFQPSNPGFPSSSRGFQWGYPEAQPSSSRFQLSIPGFQSGYPSFQSGNPKAQSSFPGAQPRSPVIQPSSLGFRPSSSGFRPSSSGFRPSSSGFQPSFSSFGR
ncbi:MAG: J domain-containing protein [Chloroflexi bacterium]|nr:J domain-containing protein [Chloroflexota bacterium]